MKIVYRHSCNPLLAFAMYVKVGFQNTALVFL